MRLLAHLGEEDAGPVIEGQRPRLGIGSEPGAHFLCPAAVLFRASGQRFGGSGKGGEIEAGRRAAGGDDARRRVFRRKPEHLPHRRRRRRDRAVCRDHRLEAAGFGGDLGHQVSETGLAQVADDGGKGIGQRPAAAVGIGQHLLQGALAQVDGLPFLHRLGVRGDVRLQREAAEQRLAERVDGLDIEAARRVQHPGEQRAGTVALLGAGFLAEQPAQRLFEAGIVGRRPVAQASGEAVGHFGGRRTRVGQAENAARLGAVQHQPQHPVAEHLGLAGSGGRSDPD